MSESDGGILCDVMSEQKKKLNIKTVNADETGRAYFFQNISHCSQP